MLVEVVVRGVGGEPWVLQAAEADILLLGWLSFGVEDNFASAAFLFRVLGGMVTATSDSEAATESS